MPKMIRATSSFGAVMWIENGDTMEINQFDFELVSDTLSIEKAFRSITITPIIKELYIEGRTFMKTTLYADSTFSATTVLRGVSPHYRSIQVQIDTLLKRFRNAAPPKDSTALVFYHQIRLEEF
jgi:hypothetical protein